MIYQFFRCSHVALQPRRCAGGVGWISDSLTGFFFSSRRRHTRFDCDWSSDVCSSDLDLSGLGMGSERMHTLTNHVAEGLTVLDVAPSRDEIEGHIVEVGAGNWRRPVLVLGGDGAYVPTRPSSARGRRPGQGRYRAKRARWQGQWRDAKGFRFSLIHGDRIVHVLSWHQVQNEDQLGKALKQVKA